MSHDSRFWHMKYQPDRQSVIVTVRPDVWAQVAVAKNWFALERQFYTMNGIVIPPTRTRHFGIRRSLVFHRPSPDQPWPSVECRLPPLGLISGPDRNRLVRDRLMTMNLVFNFLHYFHDNQSTGDQPFDLMWIGPVRGGHNCLNGTLGSPAAKLLYDSSEHWQPVTHNMRRAFHHLGGHPSDLNDVGADWYEGAIRLACGRTMLSLPYEPTRYPSADPPPEWPMMSVTTRFPAELFVLLTGLASIDAILRSRNIRRAA